MRAGVGRFELPKSRSQSPLALATCRNPKVDRSGLDPFSGTNHSHPNSICHTNFTKTYLPDADPHLCWHFEGHDPFLLLSLLRLRAFTPCNPTTVWVVFTRCMHPTLNWRPHCFSYGLGTVNWPVYALYGRRSVCHAAKTREVSKGGGENNSSLIFYIHIISDISVIFKL